MNNPDVSPTGGFQGFGTCNPLKVTRMQSSHNFSSSYPPPSCLPGLVSSCGKTGPRFPILCTTPPPPPPRTAPKSHSLPWLSPCSAWFFFKAVHQTWCPSRGTRAKPSLIRPPPLASEDESHSTGCSSGWPLPLGHLYMQAQQASKHDQTASSSSCCWVSCHTLGRLFLLLDGLGRLSTCLLETTVHSLCQQLDNEKG